MIENSSKRILVVDDDENVRKLSEHVLQSAGYRTVSSESAESAIQHLRKSLQEPQDRFAVAIIDLMLPGDHGDELVTRLKQADPQIAAILITGQKEEGIALENYQHYGFEDALLKPFPMDQLLQAVSRVIKKPSRKMDVQV